MLTRGAPVSGQGWEAVHWDGVSIGDWVRVLDGADAIVHLSGKRVDCRPTKRNLAELISSRVSPVLAVGQAWEEARQPPPVWVQLSSLARYGDGGDTTIDESTAPFAEGPPQMVQVCREWEEAYAKATRVVSRTVLLRAGVSIGGTEDPATERLVWLVRAGLGGKVGTGRQWVSWVSQDDFLAVLVRAIDDEPMAGLYHVTSPGPIRNEEMMATYRRLVGRRFGIPSPRLVTEIGARILGSDPALALTGRRAVPTRLLEEGYEFVIPDFEQAAQKAIASV